MLLPFLPILSPLTFLITLIGRIVQQLVTAEGGASMRGDRWTNRLTINKVNHASLRWTHDDPLFDASLFVVVVVVLPRLLALGTPCKVA